LQKWFLAFSFLGGKNNFLAARNIFRMEKIGVIWKDGNMLISRENV